MALPALTSYSVGTGQPIHGGRWPGGRLSGNVDLAAVLGAGVIDTSASSIAGDVSLSDAVAAGSLDGGGWGSGADVGSVASYVWTPGRDAGGAINQASVDALPANTWVRVSGTQVQALKTLIEAAGFVFASHDWSDGKDLRSTFTAWVGCDDDGRRIFYPRGGGHADASLNGVWSLDCVKMAWEVKRHPSRPDASGAAWNSSYDIPPNSSFTNYTAALGSDDGLYRDILPDGTPTSAHTYNGVWYDSSRRTINTGRVSKWAFNIDTGTWTRSRWTWDGGSATTFTINQHWYYHAGRDAIYGFPGRSDTDYYSFGKCPGGTSDWVSRSGPTNWEANAVSSCRLDDDRFIYFWYSSGAERSGIYNMATETWESGSGNAITSGKTLTYLSELMPALYVPSWGTSGQIIRRGTADGITGDWWIYDISSRTNSAYTPAGSPPGWPTYPGGKYRSMPGLGIALAFDDAAAISSPAICVMRYA